MITNDYEFQKLYNIMSSCSPCISHNKNVGKNYNDKTVEEIVSYILYYRELKKFFPDNSIYASTYITHRMYSQNIYYIPRKCDNVTIGSFIIRSIKTYGKNYSDMIEYDKFLLGYISEKFGIDKLHIMYYMNMKNFEL